MKLQEAYEILGVESDPSPDNIKKQFRTLAKQFHPDTNKDPGAEAKFKEINNAYRVASSRQSDDPGNMSSGAPFNMQDIFGGIFNSFNRKQSFAAPSHVELEVILSFQESVLGCKRDLSYVRKGKCVGCDGQGQVPQNNGCTTCHGRGMMTSQRGNMIFTTQCSQCPGPAQPIECKDCHGEGAVTNSVSVNVNIPGGVTNNKILRLSGMGNFHSTMIGMDQYTDALLHVHVKPDPDLSLQEQHVILSLNISLLQALQGCKQFVKTVLGDKEISISPLSKNKDEIIIPRVGINGTGDQKVILNVEYPENVNQLINVLSEK